MVASDSDNPLVGIWICKLEVSADNAYRFCIICAFHTHTDSAISPGEGPPDGWRLGRGPAAVDALNRPPPNIRILSVILKLRP